MKYCLKGILCLALCLGLSSSCIIAVYDYSGTMAYQPFEEFQRFLPFPSGGTLSLQNRDGYIEIIGWQDNQCEVYAERRVPLIGERRLRFLRFGQYIPKIDIDSFENFIKIQTIPAPAEEASNIVDYFIRVPEAVYLRDIRNVKGDIFLADLYGEVYAETQEGDVTVDNFSGSLRVSVERGNIEGRLYDLRTEDEIFLSTNFGSVTLYLQPDVSARVELSAANGNIYNEFSEDNPSGQKIVSLEFGKGETSVSIIAENGDITIKKILEQDG